MIQDAGSRRDEYAHLIARYARFAREEAPGRSSLYAEWAAGVAGPDGGVGEPARGILTQIDRAHRQPPLVFAVTRMLSAPESSFADWQDWLVEHADAVIAECHRRLLQTNEPLRCAALLPALATIPGPIALLELGASAGLCLFPDAYSYRYQGGDDWDPQTGESSVLLRSRWLGPRVPLRAPQVVWRAGVDLAPLDVADPDDRRFLTALVWPGETGRVERITAAMDLVRIQPPILVHADVTQAGAVQDVAQAAPPEATLVVTTPGLLPYLGQAGRERLLTTIADLDAIWLSIDPAGLYPRPRDQLQDGFVLSRDRVVIARVGALGEFVEWLPDSGGKPT